MLNLVVLSNSIVIAIFYYPDPDMSVFMGTNARIRGLPLITYAPRVGGWGRASYTFQLRRGWVGPDTMYNCVHTNKEGRLLRNVRAAPI